MPKDYTREEILTIVGIRYMLSLNAYKKYVPIIMARNVSEKTVAYILENNQSFTGIEIGEDWDRVYTGGEAFSHILGYTGKISSEEMEQYADSGRNYTSETVVLLSKGMVDSRKVKLDFSLEDMDLSEFKGKATYEQIKAYVLEQTGLKVSSLYIAQIKKKCGLDVGENFNLPKSENARQPQCTPEKEEATMQAFKHFGII